MPCYTCERCGNYSTHIRTHMLRHLSRKKPCPPNNSLISCEALKNKIVYQIPHKNAQTPKYTAQKRTNTAQIPHKSQNTEKNKNKKNIFICKFCSQSFTRKDSLTRHIKRFCHKKK